MTVRPALAATIIEHLRGYAIIGVSTDGVITEWLADAERITGYSADEAVGADFRIFYTAADRAAAAPETEIAMALAEGMAEDSRWHRRRNGQRFWANGMTLPLQQGSTSVFKIFRDETPLKLAEEQRILLLNELNHRVKNTLSTVQSVTEQTLRSAGVNADVRADLTGRLMALSRAHNVLVQQNWAGADLSALVEDVLAPYRRGASHVRIDGPLVRLHPSQAVTLSLVLHELATNAVKYGALSVETGQIHLTWNLAVNASGQRFLTLLWRETGGPPVVKPVRSGFGSRLIRSVFADAHSEARLSFEPEGLQCVASLRLIETEPSEELAGTAEATDGPPGY